MKHKRKLEKQRAKLEKKVRREKIGREGVRC